MISQSRLHIIIPLLTMNLASCFLGNREPSAEQSRADSDILLQIPVSQIFHETSSHYIPGVKYVMTADVLGDDSPEQICISDDQAYILDEADKMIAQFPYSVDLVPATTYDYDQDGKRDIIFHSPYGPEACLRIKNGLGRTIGEFYPHHKDQSLITLTVHERIDEWSVFRFLRKPEEAVISEISTGMEKPPSPDKLITAEEIPFGETRNIAKIEIEPVAMVHSESMLYSFDFEDESFGQLIPANGEWVITKLPAGNNVLEPIGSKGSVSDLYFDKDLGRDFDLTLLVYVQQGNFEAPNIGFVNGNEMINLLFASERIYLHGDGTPRTYREGVVKPFSLKMNVWYEMAVSVRNGKSVEVRINNEEIVKHTFDSAGDYSKIIFWGHPSPSIYLDEISVEIYEKDSFQDEFNQLKLPPQFYRNDFENEQLTHFISDEWRILDDKGNKVYAPAAEGENSDSVIEIPAGTDFTLEFDFKKHMSSSQDPACWMAVDFYYEKGQNGRDRSYWLNSHDVHSFYFGDRFSGMEKTFTVPVKWEEWHSLKVIFREGKYFMFYIDGILIGKDEIVQSEITQFKLEGNHDIGLWYMDNFSLTWNEDARESQ